MAKKSSELSEEDKVTTTPKKGVKGKKSTKEPESIQEEVSPVADVLDLEAVPPKPKRTKKAVVKSEDVEVQVSSTINEIISLTEDSDSASDYIEDQVVIDISGLNKTQLLDLVKEKFALGISSQLDKVIQEIKVAFDQCVGKEKEAALQQFLADGGVADDFSYRPQEEEKEFNALINEFRRQLYSLRKDAEKQKEKNLQAKTELLNKLRVLVDGEETNSSIHVVKAIQENWKAIGAVPGSQSKALWASFNALWIAIMTIEVSTLS